MNEYTSIYLHYVTSNISTSIRNKITTFRLLTRCKYSLKYINIIDRFSFRYFLNIPPRNRIVSRVQTCFTSKRLGRAESTVALNETTKEREEEREWERDTRSPFMVAIPPRGPATLASTRRRWRSKGWAKRGVSGSTAQQGWSRPSLEGVGGVAILRSSGCKTCQNPDLTASPPRLSIPPHWVTTPPRILSISIRNSLESLLWKTWHFEEKTIELFSSFFFFLLLLLLCLEIQRWSIC